MPDRNRYGLIILLLVITSAAFAQVMSPDRNMTDDRGGAGRYYTEMKPKLSNPYSKSYYYDQDWITGSIYVKGEAVVEDKPLKYEIVRQWVEVKDGDQVLVLTARKISGFEWYSSENTGSSKFIRATDFKMADGDLVPLGFLELLVDGDVKLLMHRSVQIYTANSAVSVSGSHRAHDIFYIDNYFLAKEGKLYPIRKRKRKDIYLFDKKPNEIMSYSRKRGLIFNRKKDLILIVSHYNELVLADRS